MSRLNRIWLMIRYNWEQKDWPNFTYSLAGIEECLFAFAERVGHITGITSSNGFNYKIDLGNTWDAPLSQKMGEAKNMPFWEVAEQSKNGGSLSLQDQPELNAQGRLFNGKYTSTESMGNYLAGYNANQAGMPTYDGFQRIAGALELQTHGRPDIKLGKLEMIKLATGVTSYGTHPLHGELIQQYRMSKLGWDSYVRPQMVVK